MFNLFTTYRVYKNGIFHREIKRFRKLPHEFKGVFKLFHKIADKEEHWSHYAVVGERQSLIAWVKYPEKNEQLALLCWFKRALNQSEITASYAGGTGVTYSELMDKD